MKVWELRAYLNSLPLSMDDTEVFYNGGINRFDGERVLLSVDFLEPCIVKDEGVNGVLLHDGYMEDEEILKYALLN